jgi:diphosphomevalonate decarboxylase
MNNAHTLPLLPGHIARCSPSLALIKYWGKSDIAGNRPATPSLAISLRHLVTETRAWAIEDEAAHDLVVVGGQVQAPQRFEDFFAALRLWLGRPQLRFWAESRNNFPTAAGLASSSSGFAALTLAAAAAAGRIPAASLNHGAALGSDLLSALSAIARQGSGSAARALYGGFTLLPANSDSALPLHTAAHWPELRVLVVRISEAAKELSSRVAMERTRQTSPYYSAWVADGPLVCAEAQTALAERDIQRLGPLIQSSYLRMFATMFAARPPVIYWQPASLAVIKACQALRDQGLPVWETMDAGPQVKIFTLASALEPLQTALAESLPGLQFIVDQAGEGPSFPSAPELLSRPAPELQAAAVRLGRRLDPDHAA